VLDPVLAFLPQRERISARPGLYLYQLCLCYNRPDFHVVGGARETLLTNLRVVIASVLVGSKPLSLSLARALSLALLCVRARARARAPACVRAWVRG